jgi:predicted DNA-binding antitoxin AbrB/MazE fold protein
MIVDALYEQGVFKPTAEGKLEEGTKALVVGLSVEKPVVKVTFSGVEVTVHPDGSIVFRVVEKAKGS